MNSTVAWVVMGICGAGKSTLARALAEQLHATYLDADDFHPSENLAKMNSGMALTDSDREGWLLVVRAALDNCASRGEAVVMACSGLRASYRQVLGVDGVHTRLIYLAIPPEVARMRVRQRPGHFMPESLVDSQVAALEEPDDALVLDAEASVESWLVACAVAAAK